MSDSIKSMQGQIQRLIHALEPDAALEVLGSLLKDLLVQLDEQDRVEFILGLVGHEDTDKLSSMVHL